MSLRRRHERGHDPYMDVWHRPDSLARFVGNQRAKWMSLIDIDCCEYCNLCSEPVALIETKTVWAQSKNGTVTAKLAERATLPAYLVEYETHGPSLTCRSCGRPEAIEGDDIIRFWVTQWHPADPIRKEMQPKEYAEWLWSLRFTHWKDECVNRARERMLERSEVDYGASLGSARRGVRS